jgi:hypothetical protein
MQPEKQRGVAIGGGLSLVERVGLPTFLKEDRMKFTVDRKMWFRGQGADESRMLRTDGKRCCIGFVGKQCRVPDKDMRNKKVIDAIKTPSSKALFPVWMTKDCYSVKRDIDRAYGMNDCPLMSETEREQRLKELFLRNGDEIEFVD